MARKEDEDAPRPYRARGLSGYGYCPLRPESPSDWAYRAIERQELAARCRWWDASGDEWHQRNRLHQTDAVADEAWKAWSAAIGGGLAVQ